MFVGSFLTSSKWLSKGRASGSSSYLFHFESRLAEEPPTFAGLDVLELGDRMFEPDARIVDGLGNTGVCGSPRSSPLRASIATLAEAERYEKYIHPQRRDSTFYRD